MPAAQRVKSGPCCDLGKFIESVVFTNKVQYPDGKPPVWQSVRKVCIRLTGKNGKSQGGGKSCLSGVWRKG